MRKFYITNGKNNVKYLTVPSSKIFMNDPKGLGYSQTLSTDQYGNKINAQADTNFGTIDGEIVFLNDTMSGKYDKYNSFVDFLSYKPLVLYRQQEVLQDENVLPNYIASATLYMAE